MNKLKFTSVTDENRNDFHRLMQMYAKELDQHQNRCTDFEMLKRWTDSIIEKQFHTTRYLRLCYFESSLIGFFYGKIDQAEDKGYKKTGYGYIMEFYVLPDFRRNGYGRLMFRQLEFMFERDGAKHMYLTADPVTGKPFWEAMGFISINEKSPENNQEIYERDIEL